MIMLLLGSWLVYHFMGGSAKPFSLPIEQAEALVKQHVADPVRQKQAVAILQQMEELDKQRAKVQHDTLSSLPQLANDRTATAAQFMSIAEAEHAKTVVFQAQMIDLRTRLKGEVTATEWKLIFPPSPTPP